MRRTASAILIMTRPRALLLGAAAVIAGALAFDASASGPPDLKGESVIRYADTGLDLEGAQRVIVGGQRTADGGCLFESPLLRVTEVGRVVRLDELAYDPDSCRSLVQIGFAPAPAVAHEGEQGAGYASQDSPAIGPGAPQVYASALPPAPVAPDIGNLTLTGHFGYHRSWFDDPIWIDVNAVRNYVGWSEDGSCTYSQSGWHSLSWLVEDGWTLQGAQHWLDWDCTRVHSYSDVHYKNGVFCAFFDTWTHHSYNHAFGWYDGTLNGYTVWSKSGPCSGLLSHHAKVVKYY